MKKFNSAVGLLMSSYMLSSFAATNLTDATSEFNVTANVSASCSVTVDHDLSFGAYDPFSSSDATSSNTVLVTCTDGSAYSVYLNAGLNGSITDREMIGGTSGDLMHYQLYIDPTYATIWGDGSVNPGYVEGYNCGVGSGSSQPYTVYGKVPKNQISLAADSYSDTITVSVDY